MVKSKITLYIICGLFLIGCGSSASRTSGTPEMVLVKGGTFIMGSPVEETNSFYDERPQHWVTLSNFYISKYQITQKEWEEVMGDNPSNFAGDQLPVERISWYDALIFCNKLSMRKKLNPAYRIAGSTDPTSWGAAPEFPDTDAAWDAVEIVKGANGYRLPTEAQWEFACRAGNITPFNVGENVTVDQANFDGRYPYKNNPEGIFRETTILVGSFRPNTWNLHDMHGNIWEWCFDWYGIYTADPQTDPQGAVIGAYRVARGGSWTNSARFLRSAARGSSAPAYREAIIGLRVVRP